TCARVLWFLAWDNPLLLGAAAIGLGATAADGKRALIVALGLSFLALPVLQALAAVKGYYVHPRHAIFLVPAFVVLAALGLVGVCRRVVGEQWALAAAVMLVTVTQGPTVARYLADPGPFFAHTKTLRDVRGVVTGLQGAPPGGRWLLLAERQSVPNAVL